VGNSAAHAQPPGGSEALPPALLPAIPVPPPASGFASEYVPAGPAAPPSTTIIINQPGPMVVLPPPTLQTAPVAPVTPVQPLAPPAPAPTGLPPATAETTQGSVLGWSGLTYISNAGKNGLSIIDLSNEGQLPHLW